MAVKILVGDALEVLSGMEDESVHMCVTSPPYWGLRAYKGDPGMIGLEKTFDEHLENLLAVFREVRRVLRKDGCLFLNYGDGYVAGQGGRQSSVGEMPKKSIQLSANPHSRPDVDVGSWSDRDETSKTLAPHAYWKPKDLMLMPARVAIALQEDGWWVRSEIIWHKPNPMPESVRDRPTSAHEKLFLLSKSSRYFYDADAVRVASHREVRLNNYKVKNSAAPFDPRNDTSGIKDVPGTGCANLRNVWTIPTHGFKGWTATSKLVPISVSQAQELVSKGSESGGGICRTTSPNCRVHEGLPDSVSKAFCGGLSDRQLTGILDSGCDLDSVRRGDYGAIPLIGGHSPSLQATADYSDPSGSPAATVHSKGNRRTDRAPSSSERATTSEQTPSGIGRTGLLQGQPASTSRDTGENRTGGGTPPLHSSPKTAPDSVRKSALVSSCQCPYYQKVTSKSSHFATFPPKLVEPCIKAGTSEKGVCSECGAPWVRKMDIVSGYEGARRHDSLDKMGLTQGTGWKDSREIARDSSRKTTGWSPSCSCDAPSTPATVLECFAGAGTTGLVADRLGRNAVLIEISAEYAEMARNRIHDDNPLFTDVSILKINSRNRPLA